VQEVLLDAVRVTGRVLGNVADAKAGAVSVAAGGVSVAIGNVAVITIGVGGTDPGRTHAAMKRIKNPKYNSLLCEDR
jgi:hypothetical protein